MVENDVIIGLFGLLLISYALLVVAWVLFGDHLAVVRTKTIIRLIEAGYEPYSNHHHVSWDKTVYWKAGQWKGTTREAVRRERVQAKLKQYALSGKFEIVSKKEEPTRRDGDKSLWT